MPSSPALKPQSPMSGKTTPLLPELDLNLDVSQFEGINELIGKTYGPPPSPEICLKSLLRSEWYLIAPYEQLEPIIQRVQELSELYSCSGVYLGLAKKLGKKRIIAETGAGQHGVATAAVSARTRSSFETLVRATGTTAAVRTASPIAYMLPSSVGIRRLSALLSCIVAFLAISYPLQRYYVFASRRGAQC